jgi:5-methyltetrahydrofolate corrinoid/iron sulfur protein methyltransferase
MIIIGEKINGAIPSVKKAIEERNNELIAQLAKKQSEAGANYLDVCAGTGTDQEYDALTWLINVVQDAVDTPLCIDSPNPRMIEKVYLLAKRPGILNSISLEAEKCEVLLPLLKDNNWQIVALACDQNGIAASADDKVRLAFQLIEKADAHGVTPDRVHVDPLVLALSAVNDSALNFFEAIIRIKQKYPTVNVTAALSNISYGMPARKLVNSNFLTLSMQAGLDSVIADPLNRDVIGTIYATEALLNRDAFCRKYNTAFRKGLIGEVKKAL